MKIVSNLESEAEDVPVQSKKVGKTKSQKTKEERMKLTVIKIKDPNSKNGGLKKLYILTPEKNQEMSET